MSPNAKSAVGLESVHELDSMDIDLSRSSTAAVRRSADGQTTLDSAPSSGKKASKRKCVKVFWSATRKIRKDFKWMLSGLLLSVMVYLIALSYFRKYFMPFQPAFAVFVLFVSSHALGWVSQLIGLPPLLGMLVAGVLLRNISYDPLMGLPDKWASAIRVCSLSIIFVRSGLELDWKEFKKIGTVALRLTICPGIAEASTVAGMAIVLFGMPLLLGYTLGFVLAAVSPAVVVNGMFALQKAGYGIKKGVPSLAVAAASFDDVVAITGYSLFIGLAIPQGALAWSLAFGPLNVIFGIVGGLTGGLALSLTYFWRTRWQRSGAIFLTSQMLMAFFVYFNFKGAGALSSLLVGAVTKNMWEAGIPKCLSTGKSTHHAHEAEADIAVAWQTFGQPMLFSVIGAALDFGKLPLETIPLSIAVIVTGVCVRLLVAGTVIWGVNLNLKERAFVALSWLPKATVQAALASGPLEAIHSTKMLDPAWKGQCNVEDSPFLGDPEFVDFCVWDDWGQDIVTTAVFAILLTAPLGVLCIANVGPLWLTKDTDESGAESSLDPAVIGTSSYVRLEDEISIEDEQEDGIKGITSNLQEFDLQLRTLQDTATNMLKDPERVEEFSAIFHETVAAMRKQIVVMEYQSTPANLETMGQFFRVLETENNWQGGQDTGNAQITANSLAVEGLNGTSQPARVGNGHSQV